MSLIATPANIVGYLKDTVNPKGPIRLAEMAVSPQALKHFSFILHFLNCDGSDGSQGLAVIGFEVEDFKVHSAINSILNYSPPLFIAYFLFGLAVLESCKKLSYPPVHKDVVLF